MYPYHNMIKKRIKQGELSSIVILNDENYAFAFIFRNYPFFRPIKYHSIHRYSDILKLYNVDIDELKR